MHNRNSRRRRKIKGDWKYTWKITAENLPNLKEKDIKTQEAQRVSNKMKPNRPTPRYNMVKMAKVKDKETVLKAARENQRVHYKGFEPQ